MKYKKIIRTKPKNKDLVNILCNDYNLLKDYKDDIKYIKDDFINRTVAKSCRFRAIEMNLVKGFLEKNKISFGVLVKALFYHNSTAFTDTSIAVMENEGMDTKFADTNPSKWDTRSYLPNTRVDYGEAYKNDSSGENPSINLHRFQANLIDKYLKETNSHFNKFIKESLLSLKVFPKEMGSVMRLQERAVSNNLRASGNTVKTKTMTLTTHPFERFFITNFTAFAQSINKNITLSKLIKYRLYKLKYIPDLKNKNAFKNFEDDLHRINKEFIKTHEYLNNTEFKEKTREEYEKIYNQDQAGTANISLSFSYENATDLMNTYKKEGFTSMTNFIRAKVWKHYDIYPYPVILEIIEIEKQRGRKTVS